MNITNDTQEPLKTGLRKLLLPAHLILVILSSLPIFAHGREVSSLFNTHSVGTGLNIISTQQQDTNDHLDSVGSPTSLPMAFNLDVNYEYRFYDSYFALQVRPGYFLQSGSGDGFNYKLNGTELFVLLKRFFWEEENLRPYFLTGAGYGKLKGDFSQPTGSVEFEGSGFGALIGAGVERCSDRGHCFVIELSYRHLPVSRNVIGSRSGTLTGFTQTTPDRELEFGGNNLETSMSGITLRLGYQRVFGLWHL